jgi:hypothetical protein
LVLVVLEPHRQLLKMEAQELILFLLQSLPTVVVVVPSLVALPLAAVLVVVALKMVLVVLALLVKVAEAVLVATQQEPEVVVLRHQAEMETLELLVMEVPVVLELPLQ